MGAKFAQVEGTLTLAMLARAFRFELPEGVDKRKLFETRTDSQPPTKEQSQNGVEEKIETTNSVMYIYIYNNVCTDNLLR